MKKYLKKISVLLCVFGVSTSSYADSPVNTVKIVQASVSGLSSCLHYRVLGACFWLKCSFTECHIETTFRVKHYLPDVVMTVSGSYGQNPWLYANKVVDPILKKAGDLEIKNMMHTAMGFGDEGSRSERDVDNRYKEIDVIGNPGVLFFKAMKKFILPSTATPFVPYYSSFLDAYAWRYLGLEKFYPSTYIPGLHDVGIPVINDWGPLYPRNGFVIQPNDGKASAVLLLRAASIMTQTAQPHLYFPLSQDCGQHCKASIAKENSDDVSFQQVYPNPSNQCIAFGTNDVTSLLPWGSQASQKGKGRYVWLMWRRYQGCIPNDGIYIGQI